MRPYKVCKRCVMDTTDPNIIFDDKEYCNHCNNKLLRIKKLKADGTYSKENLRLTVNTIKKAGEKLKYDCIIGVSGGVDSSYLCHLASKLGLRPLLVHFDNGWNTEFAIENIKKMKNAVKFDYVDYKVNPEEFVELQKAYFRAGVIDIEVLTDQALAAVLYQKAEEHKIRYIIGGSNIATESIMGSTWNYSKWDVINLVAICQQFSHKKIETYPLHNYLKVSQEYTQVELLNYIEYSKQNIIDFLKKEYNWQPYPGKHYESYFTKFYQAYILPRKFGIDKRRAHLSDLIVSGEISRKNALCELEKPLYTTEDLEKEKIYILNKLGFTEAEFEEIMNSEPIPHTAYPCI